MSESGLKIETREEAETFTVAVAGELDLASTDTLDAALAEAERSEATVVLLDIDELDFIDSTGMQAIVRAARRSESGAGRLRITRGRGHVAAMFRLTALDHTLPFVGPPAPEAAAAER